MQSVVKKYLNKIIKDLKAVFSFFILALMSLSTWAQDFQPIKGDCLPPPADDDVALARGPVAPRRLPALYDTWDPTRVYKQLVILIDFKSDSTYFRQQDPRAFYDDMFNTTGFNQRSGKGCVAEYFKTQSNGIANFQFDVYGPYTVDQKAQPYTKPDENSRNYGRDAMIAATKMFLAEHPEVDFSQYDWNDNGKVNQVIYIAAGYAGNQSSSMVYGYVWPNTSSFSTITTHDGKKISDYTISGELWPNNTSCGLGTICHEFGHSLGLPDIYPVNKSAGFSTCDEWDLMDGGNFTNYGWAPPNFTAMEKMVLGWLEPVELTEPTTITGMKPLEEGGVAYVISHSTSEFLLLENRQQRGWDIGAPGNGLVVYHVSFDKSVWKGNSVNNDPVKPRFEIVHADNLSYDEWVDLLLERGAKKTADLYQNANRMNSHIFSTSPYPWTTDSTTFVNDQLTDTSVPAVKMNYPNLEGEMALGKPITNIRMTDDGLISFDFMGGDDTAVEAIRQRPSGTAQFFDMTGRRLSSAPSSRVYIIKGTDGKVRKVIR